MNSDNLTPAQLQEIHDHLWPAANYLVRLKQKMEQRQFPRNDQLYLKTVNAYDHLLTLLHELHGRRQNLSGFVERVSVHVGNAREQHADEQGHADAVRSGPNDDHRSRSPLLHFHEVIAMH